MTLKMFDCERGNTMKLLEKNESRVAITTDMWTSSNQKRGLIVVTMHFIDGGWILQSNILRAKKRSRASSVKSELDHYLDEDVLPRREDFDILLWWKINRVKYPTLRASARDILVIPVSTIASESAFSTSGRIVCIHCSRLHPKTLEALMCARSWLWAAENKDQDAMCSDGYATIYDEIDSDGEGTIID